jgi:hypothetical protein
MGIYKAPSMSDNDFSTYFIKNIDECIRYYENIIITGDLNVDLLTQTNHKLNESMTLYDLTNVIKLVQGSNQNYPKMIL